MMGVNKIKGYRVMSGLTQKEMAEKLGLSVRGYVLKENGTSSFKGSELSKIQTILKERNLDVKIDDLVEA